ncbi:hypothetical protein KY343_03815 [Candidatus Woesearchaeota archaeon]|nr:hypothetical protein [Candidatus Woesearchaeota archaeon]
MKEEKLKKLINKKSHENREPHVWEITSSAPVQIEGLRIFQSTHDPEMDPMPVNYWILSNGKLYSADELEKALEKKKIIPRDDKEANNFKKIIEYVASKEDQVLL